MTNPRSSGARVCGSWRLFPALVALAAMIVGCGDGGSGGGAGGTGQGGGGLGGAGGTGGTGGVGQGGSTATSLDGLLAELRADLEGTMDKYAASDGWPVWVEGGHLFVSTNPSLDLVAGDHDGWVGSPMKIDNAGFRFLHLKDVAAGSRYKFTNKTIWEADPWARSYTYDDNGEMSLVAPNVAHLDRFFGIGDAQMPERTVNVWVPEGTATHVLYVHDGQNLFDPEAVWGGWMLQSSVPVGMMLVGIDNTGIGRMDEYTHVPDIIDLDEDGMVEPWGGKGDAYADFVNGTVRKLVADRYGEPPKVGTMGSSLGGLISFHIADRFPDEYEYAASLSGTMGWGKMGETSKNETLIERYAMHGHRATVLYLDSGGGDPALGQAENEAKCKDTDGDGIEDDVGIGDNACENAQMRDVLVSVGYTLQTDVYHWWEAGAPHNEAAWRARVFRPMDLFKGL
ncbi:alpha/beta hydrolase [Polyangium jinanense]|uniref:Prolyl oligopeptidase family serine peptidase n=1 Tax=Polyangium jinanense TaxID=2829994 RepID=A0A9X4AQE9_9BACT|nr:alpha/beta hydrolase-fold protein [Polyangium jinanense]MDC3981023.1 prolyl oligopeptidase family serine peptidase [Polyangium jinanense]